MSDEADALARLRHLTGAGDVEAAEHLFALARRSPALAEARRLAARTLLGGGAWRLESASLSATGARREHNEDAVLDWQAAAIFGVLDGSGGHVGGVDACAFVEATLARSFGLPARAALDRCLLSDPEAVWQAIERALPAPGDPAAARSLEALERAAALASGLLFANQHLIDVRHGALATAALAAVVDGELALVHAGDTRAYLARDGELVQLTRDHTLFGEMQAMSPQERAAFWSRAEIEQLHDVVTRAIGVAAAVELDTLCEPLEPGDVVLLCTDGVWKALDEHRLLEDLVWAARGQLAAAAESLRAELAAAFASDDASAIIVALSRR